MSSYSIKHHLVDGADFQAQCVSIYMRNKEYDVIQESWDKEENVYKAEIKIGRCEGDREDRYIFKLVVEHDCHIEIIGCFWVYEHRNIDNICVVEFDSSNWNTPRIEDVPMKDKYDYSKSFSYMAIKECGDWIAKRMKTRLSNFYKAKYKID